MNAHKQMRQAVRDYFADKVPPDVTRIGRLIYWDLWFGPLTGCDVCGVDSLDECTCEHKWPGFEKAVDLVSSWISDQPQALWFDMQSGWASDIEPQAEEVGDELVEPCWEDYCLINKEFIVDSLFGDKVSEYVR